MKPLVEGAVVSGDGIDDVELTIDCCHVLTSGDSSIYSVTWTGVSTLFRTTKMTDSKYRRKCTWLREVLKDAEERGDIYLEYDVKEQLIALRDAYYKEDES